MYLPATPRNRIFLHCCDIFYLPTARILEKQTNKILSQYAVEFGYITSRCMNRQSSSMFHGKVISEIFGSINQIIIGKKGYLLRNSIFDFFIMLLFTFDTLYPGPLSTKHHQR